MTVSRDAGPVPATRLQPAPRVSSRPGGDAALSRALADAIRQGEFVPQLQPVVSVQSGAVERVEALPQWQRGNGEVWSASAFVPAATAAGLLRAIILQVLEAAITRVVTLRAAGHPVGLSANLPIELLGEQAFLRATVELLGHQLPASEFVIELNERALEQHPALAIAAAAHLARIGVRFSIDRFGTANAPLAALLRTQPAEVKIDRCAALARTSPTSAAEFVRAAAELAHALGARATAFGVADSAFATDAAALGCDAMQGSAICPPLEASALLSWLQARG